MSFDNAVIGFMACALSNRSDMTPKEWIQFTEHQISCSEPDVVRVFAQIGNPNYKESHESQDTQNAHKQA